MNAHRFSLDVTSWPRVNVGTETRDASSWAIVGEENRGLLRVTAIVNAEIGTA